MAKGGGGAWCPGWEEVSLIPHFARDHIRNSRYVNFFFEGLLQKTMAVALLLPLLRGRTHSIFIHISYIHPCHIWISYIHPCHILDFIYPSMSYLDFIYPSMSYLDFIYPSVSYIFWISNIHPCHIWISPEHEYIYASSWVTPVCPQSSVTKGLLSQMGAGSFRWN